MMKKLFFGISFLFLFLFNPQIVLALDCRHLGGTIQDVFGRPIQDALVVVHVDGQKLLHEVRSREDGGFTYGWPVRGEVTLTVVAANYQTASFAPSDCLGLVLSLAPSEITRPPVPPGDNNRCGTGCADNTQCMLADDGCTLCYSGICINPESEPRFLTPTPIQGSSPTPPEAPGQIPTAIGKIDVTNPTAFIASVLKLALGIGGGIAFLLMLFGSFQIITSSGQPEKVQAGKELITSALAGLLMIIFSVFLLELIGVKILAIPGFGK